MSALLPDLTTTLAVLPLALLLTLAAAAAAAWLRVRRRVAAPYTRKTFHIVIISAAMFVQLRFGFAGTVVYGSVVAAAVLFAAWRGDGFPLYEALARPTDAPHRTLFILVPLATTAAGGLLANALFPAWAHVGYFVIAWGDAVGEPVGTRWGRHRYRAPSLAGVSAYRSLEGSFAVATASTLAALIAITLADVPLAAALIPALVVGAVAALVEAVSHHGLDNLTVQLAAAIVAHALLDTRVA